MHTTTYFPKVRRMLLFDGPLLLTPFGQLPRCFAGTLLLSLCLLLRPSLKFWSVGATLMRFTWTYVTVRRILVSNFGMTCNSLREFYTLDWSLHVCALPENGLRRRQCPEIRNPIVVHQKTDVKMNFVTISYHFFSQVAPFDRDKHLRRILFLSNFPSSIWPQHFCHYSI